jgi:hypothetical protein
MQIAKVDSEIKKVVWSYLKMALYACVIIVTAKALALVCNKYVSLPKVCATVFEYLGYFCWATALGSSGYTIMTWSQGDTPQERLDQSLSMWLSLVGVFSFVLARDLIVT